MKDDQIVNQKDEPTGLVLTQQEVTLPTVDAAAYGRDMAALEAAEKIDPETARNEVTRYWEASKGDSLTAVLKGWKVIETVDEKTSEVKRLPACILRSKDGDYINASTIVVDSLLGKVAEGSVVYIKCTETKSGKAKRFDVRTLSTPEA